MYGLLYNLHLFSPLSNKIKYLGTYHHASVRFLLDYLEANSYQYLLA